MFKINSELKQMLTKTNSILHEKYITNINYNQIRSQIQSNVNQIIKFKKATPEIIQKSIGKNANPVAIAGSLNTFGNKESNNISILRTVAKPTKGDCLELCDINCSLIHDNKNPKVELAKLKLNLALNAIQTLNTKMIFFQGSLVNLYKADVSIFEQLISIANTNKIFILGIADEFYEKSLNTKLNIKEIENFYDYDILFNALNTQEGFIFDIVPGIKRCLLRPSSNPAPIAIDFFESNEKLLPALISITLALIPENNDNIPYLLSLACKESEISNEFLNSTIETFIDKDIIKKLFERRTQCK